MDNRATHEAIKKKFHLNNEKMRNLPFCSGFRYSRNNLAQLLGELKFNRGSEIGVRRGTFSSRLCKCNPNIELYCIDPWKTYNSKFSQDKQDLIYAEAVKRLKPYNATIIRKTSMDALSDFKDGGLDFVYIDGNHNYDFIAPDIIYWSNKVRSGGIVAVHDFYGGQVDVQRAVEGYVWSHNIIPWYITKELAPTAYWVKP